MFKHYYLYTFFYFKIIKNKIKFIKKEMFLISLILQLILLYFPLSLSEKVKGIYEISLTIRGTGYQVIVYGRNHIPNKVIINGIEENVNEVMYYLNDEESNITIKWDSMPTLKELFTLCNTIISIDFSRFDSSQATDISGMFDSCTMLKYINFTNFDTSSVEKMDKMFYYCINLVSLDLSNFNTKSAISMEGMFQNAESLISLDLTNFNTSKITNMKNMFNNCKSLIYINLNSFIENKDVIIEDIFSSEINNLIYCINEENSPNIYSILLSKNLENDCNNFCFDNKRIIDINKKICVQNDDDKTNEKINNEINDFPENTENFSDNIDKTNSYKETEMIININKNSDDIYEITQNTVDTLKINDNLNFKTESVDKINTEIIKEESTNNNEIIEKAKEFIINNLNSLITNVINGTKQDIIGKYNNISYQLTTTENQKNNNYTNISTINFGDCEDKLKQIYGINNNFSLIILKIDYFVPTLLIPLIGYEVYHPINQSKLDLNYCNDTLIKLNIPVTIDEDKIYKYDPNSDFYNDECYAFTTENGTDIILNDRKNEFKDNNLSLCENNCNFKVYDSDSKKALCECEVKIGINKISEILNSNNILSNNFNYTNDNKLNIGTMKCVSLLFSKNGLLNNIGSYILLFTITLFGISIIIFYKCGYQLIENNINIILESKIKIKKIINKLNSKQSNKIRKKKDKKKNIKIVSNHNKINTNIQIKKIKEKNCSKSKLSLKNKSLMIYNEKYKTVNKSIIIFNKTKIKLKNKSIKKKILKKLKLIIFLIN